MPSEVAVQDEVRHARERVGAVGGRSAARHDLDLRNSAVGKLSMLTVPSRSAGVTRAPSSRTSVRCGPHRAQIEEAAAGAAEQRAAAALRALRLEELRQLVELVRHRRPGLERLDLVHRHGRDGHRRGETGRALNARAGDRDLLELACRARFLRADVAALQQQRDLRWRAQWHWKAAKAAANADCVS